MTAGASAGRAAPAPRRGGAHPPGRERSGEQGPAAERKAFQPVGERPEPGPGGDLLAADEADDAPVPAGLELVVPGMGGVGILVAGDTPHVVHGAAVVQTPENGSPVEEVSGALGGEPGAAPAEEVDEAPPAGDGHHGGGGFALDPSDEGHRWAARLQASDAVAVVGGAPGDHPIAGRRLQEQGVEDPGSGLGVVVEADLDSGALRQADVPSGARLDPGEDRLGAALEVDEVGRAMLDVVPAGSGSETLEEDLDTRIVARPLGVELEEQSTTSVSDERCRGNQLAYGPLLGEGIADRRSAGGVGEANAQRALPALHRHDPADLTATILGEEAVDRPAAPGAQLAPPPGVERAAAEVVAHGLVPPIPIARRGGADRDCGGGLHRPALKQPSRCARDGRSRVQYRRMRLQDEVPASATGRAPAAGMGSRAVRNTAVVLAARVISRLIALAAVILISTHLTADGFGRLQTLVTYTALTATVVDLGFNTLFVREGARHPEEIERYLANVLSLKALLSLVGLGVLAGVLRIPGLSDLLLPAFALMVGAAYANLLRGTFYALQRVAYEAVDIVLESVVLLGLVVLGGRTGQSTGYYVWAYAASYLVSCVYFVVVLAVTGMARPRWRLDLDVLRPWAVASLPLAVTYVMTNVYFKVDVPILQHVRPYAEVGWYTLAYKPFEALLFVPLTMRTVVFPVLAVYWRTSRAQLGVAVRTFFKALAAVGWPCTVGLVVLAPQLTAALHLYPQSAAALRILGVGVVIMFVDNTFIAALNAIDRQALYAGVITSAFVFNVLANLVAIPRWGYIGASWTTVLTEAWMATLGWWVLGRVGERIPVVRSSARILVAGLLMGAALLPLRAFEGKLVVVSVVVGALVYLVALVLVRAFDATEVAVVRRALRWR